VSVSRAIASTCALLEQAGIVSPRAEARTLVCFALDVEPSQLALIDDLTTTQQELLDQAVKARISGQPLQHVTGRAYFRTICVHVGPGVFIPRPETELLAGWAIDQVRAGHGRVVELCAGSGAMSCSIAAESSPAACWAVERSDQAYPYLVENLAGTGVIPVHQDMVGALAGLDGSIDLVVANPPYVPLSQDLPRDVQADPDEALFSGEEGLDATVDVAEVAMRLLRPGGVVGSEHGDDQAEQVRQIFAQAGFEQIRTHSDLGSRPRFVTARKPGSVTGVKHGMMEP